MLELLKDSVTLPGAAMVTWGEIQSVIQLAVALDAIYLALREIHNPYVRAEEKALSELASLIKERISETPNGVAREDLETAAASAIQVNIAFGNLIRRFERWDDWVGGASAIFVFGYIALLIVSGFFYSTKLDNGVALAICVLGFVPITIGFFINLSLVQSIQRSVRLNRREIEARLIPSQTAAV